MTEPPDTTTPRFETLQRVEAAHLVASVSSCSFEDSMLIVAALENDGVFMVREVELDESYALTEARLERGRKVLHEWVTHWTNKAKT